MSRLAAVPLFPELPMPSTAHIPLGVPPAYSRVVIGRAGGQCECTGFCGQHKTAGRCPLRHGAWNKAKRRDNVLALAPKPAGLLLPLAAQVRLPDAELMAWCEGCQTKAQKLAAS